MSTATKTACSNGTRRKRVRGDGLRQVAGMSCRLSVTGRRREKSTKTGIAAGAESGGMWIA